MTDYKRMVSYMYQYENGVKRKNVGYARVEAKNGQCKITLHMQLLGQLDSIFPTYLIQRDNNNMELIYLGDTMLRNQVMDSKLSANEANIMDSGHNLSEMGGMLLFLNDKIFFATEWDDKPITVKEVLEALKPKKEPEPSKVVAEGSNNSEEQGIYKKFGSLDETIVSETAEVMETEVGNESVEATIQAVKSDIVESISQENIDTAEKLSLEEELQLPKYKLPRGWKTIERLNDQHSLQLEFQENMNNTDVPYFEPKGYHEYFEESSDKYIDGVGEGNLERNLYRERKNELEEDFEDDIQDNYEDNLEDGIVIGMENNIEEILEENLENGPSGNPVNNFEDSSNLEENVQDVNNMSINFDANFSYEHQPEGDYEDEPNPEGKLSKEDLEDPPEHPTAKRFFDNYPRIYPFEDNEIMFCVKIEPGDIGLLPKETWVLSSNSFLMHGFYCYHHLIFAKIKNRYGCQYILGIPGIYHNRESFMARMFGFESFKSIRKRELKQGDFGYWYIPINF